MKTNSEKNRMRNKQLNEKSFYFNFISIQGEKKCVFICVDGPFIPSYTEKVKLNKIIIFNIDTIIGFRLFSFLNSDLYFMKQNMYHHLSMYE